MGLWVFQNHCHVDQHPYLVWQVLLQVDGINKTVPHFIKHVKKFHQHPSGTEFEFILFQFPFNADKTCEKVCTKKYETSGGKEDKLKLDFLKRGMELNYQHHW